MFPSLPTYAQQAGEVACFSRDGDRLAIQQRSQVLVVDPMTGRTIDLIEGFGALADIANRQVPPWRCAIRGGDMAILKWPEAEEVAWLSLPYQSVLPLSDGKTFASAHGSGSWLELFRIESERLAL